MAFRQSGAAIRQLPSIAPPPAFREAVFAAIRKEAQRQAPSVAQLSRAATNPELMVVRPVTQKKRSASFTSAGITRLKRPGVRASLIAAAAVLLLSLVGARVVSVIGTSVLGSSAANLGAALQPKIFKYPLGSLYTVPTSAMATTTWLAYTASDSAHNSMLFLENRSTKQVTPILASPTTATLTVRALTDQWVIWSSGDGTSVAPWQLYATALVVSGNGESITLVDSAKNGPDTPATLGGVWASGDIILVADAAHSGAGELLKIDLTSGAPVTAVITHGQIANDVLTNPTYDNGAYYWADVWFDTTTGLHSAIWKADQNGNGKEVSASEAAFHPEVAHNTLVWVEVSQVDLQAMPSTVATSGNSGPDTNLEIVSSLSGVLDARDLTTGKLWQVGSNVNVPNISAAGKLLLWQSGAQTHAYDLHSKASLAADAQVRPATFASADGSTIVWAESSSRDLFVYDAA